MSRRCDLTGTSAQTGHLVSHSNRKTKRRFIPNLQSITFHSDILRRGFSLRVTPATLRTVDHNGGFDSYLLNTSNLKLSEKAKVIKRQIEKAMKTPKTESAPKTEKPTATKKKATAKKPEKKKRPVKKAKTEKKAKAVKKSVAKPKKAKAKTEKKPAKKAAKKTVKAKKPAAKKTAAKKKA